MFWGDFSIVNTEEVVHLSLAFDENIIGLFFIS